MTQEMKLLQALCEALGFDVETTIDYDERKESEFGMAAYRDGRIDNPRRMEYNENNVPGMAIDSDGMYTSLLKSPIVNYKLTKRAE